MKISLRGWVVLGAFAAVLALLAVVNSPLLSAADKPSEKRAPLNEDQLGNLLEAMGLKATKEEKRYDFNFKALYGKEEWGLTMSAVLSQDGKSIWVMAWLDELPRSAADVPRTALLRLLANNDRMGSGKFFAYIASNRRFVLQRVVPNQDIGTKDFRAILQDLGASIVETYPYWSVAGWKDGKNRNRSGQNMPRNTAKSAPARPTASRVQNRTRTSSLPGKARIESNR